MREKAIVFENVCKNYRLYNHLFGGIKQFLFDVPAAVRQWRCSSFEVLRDVSFEVYRGESLGIVGRNGVGKSTLLGLVAGVLKPTRGRIAVYGRISPLLELGGGFHPELTGKENILLNGVLLGLTKFEVKKKLSEIVEFSELGAFIDQPIRTYSSGMLARLGFSVIAFLDPEILLIDEVLAVGDQGFQKKCVDRMLSFRKQGVTIVFVSHSMDSVGMICDRAIWIEDKTIRANGRPSDVVSRYV